MNYDFFWFKIILVLKKSNKVRFLPKKFGIKGKIWSKDFLVQIELVNQRIFGPNRFLIQKKFGPKK